MAYAPSPRSLAHSRVIWWSSLVVLTAAACASGESEQQGFDGPQGGAGGASGTAGSGGDGTGGNGGGAGQAGGGGAAGKGGAGAGGNGAAAGKGGSTGGASGAAMGGAGAGGGGMGGAGMGGAGSGGAGTGGGGTAGVAGSAGAGTGGGGTGGTGGSGMSGTGGTAGFATCATGVAKGETRVLPVDIIWMVDNSISMSPAIDEVTKGLNAFAAAIDGKMLDYKVIMLSLRGAGSITLPSGARYGVCIPQPLAGDASCGNGPRFFQSSVDIRSTQPLEQFLGTLGQTSGYTVAEGPLTGGRGGDPWKAAMRADATKSIVVVSDDNSRLLPADFLHFAGGKNPFNTMTLPAGILEPFWGGIFDKWVFHGLYGWGSDTDPLIKCKYMGGTSPPASGTTYTELIQMTKGARAKICDGAAAWTPFFDAIAKSVVETSKIACSLDIPPPPSGTSEIDPNKVNVSFVTNMVETVLFQVDGPMGPVTCDPVKGGYYFDDPKKPTKIILCPASCDAANAAIGAGKSGEIRVTFGCNSIKP